MSRLTLWDAFTSNMGVYEIPDEYSAVPFTPENFVEVIRRFVLECKALPQIRTRVPVNRRLEYHGTPAIYLVPWGGDPKCTTVVFYDVPEDVWLYMDQSRGEWRRLYEQYVVQLYGELSEKDRQVLEFGRR